MIFKKKILPFIFMLLAMFMNSACGVYSFTGASVSPDVKSIRIGLLENTSGFALPTISQKLTESLKSKILNSTNLTISTEASDLDISGSITAISVNPLAIQGNQQSLQNRLEISVNINFVNSKNDKQNFEKVFKRYGDFASNKTLDQVQNTLLEQISQDLVQDIFNAAFINW